MNNKLEFLKWLTFFDHDFFVSYNRFGYKESNWCYIRDTQKTWMYELLLWRVIQKINSKKKIEIYINSSFVGFKDKQGVLYSWYFNGKYKNCKTDYIKSVDFIEQAEEEMLFYIMQNVEIHDIM